MRFAIAINKIWQAKEVVMSRKQFRRIIGFILTAMLIVGTLMMAASTAAAANAAAFALFEASTLRL